MKEDTKEENNEPKVLKTVYQISVPYISNGLKRSFNKQIEVYELNFLDNNRYEFVQRHFYKNKSWKQDKNKSRAISKFSPKVKVHSEIVFKRIMSNVLLFDDLEVAKASKFLLIDKMFETYEAEIKRINDLFKRNVPDVKSEINETKQKNPEFFI